MNFAIIGCGLVAEYQMATPPTDVTLAFHSLDAAGRVQRMRTSLPMEPPLA